MSSTQDSTDEGFLSARSSVEPEQLGQPQTDDALSAAISLLDLRSSTSAPKGDAPTPAKTEDAVATPTPRSLPPELAVFIQEACLEHRYLRTKDVSTIVERPERLRAVKIGIAAAFARLHPDYTPQQNGNALEEAMDRLGLGSDQGASKKVLGGERMEVVRSEARMALGDAALDLAHPVINKPPEGFVPPKGPSAPVTPSASPAKGALPLLKADSLPPPTSYAIQLARLCRDSPSGHGGGRSEVPPHLPQGDLYLCPGSEDAILGALGTCCEAVDSIFAPSGSKPKRAFVSVRPPGHHCAESDPMGFCWVNNVAVAAAHAHLKHAVDRVIILDADLHHGNGTQDIVWKLNENAERQVAAEAAIAAASTNSTPRKSARSPAKSKAPLPATSSSESSPSSPPKRRELRLCYASLHDIFSYPCEDGDPDMVRDASVNLLGGHGQWIANVHLQPWSNEEDFFGRLYPTYREGMLGAARRFCEETGSTPGRTLVFISAGFDACEHEGAGMSRHSRNVPVSFYRRFTQDVVGFADRFAEGRVVSVLEGGYSDRALTSATLAHLSGFASASDTDEADVPSWWKLEHLLALEKTCKAKGGRKPPMGLSRSTEEAWLTATLAHFRLLEPASAGTATAPPTEQNTPSTAMQLRVRKQRLADTAEEASPSVAKTKSRAVSGRAPRSVQSTPRPKEQPPPMPPLTEPRPPTLPTMGAFEPRPPSSFVTDTSNDGYTTPSRELSEPLTDATSGTSTTTDSGASLDADDERASQSNNSSRASSSPPVQLEAGKLPKVKWTWNAGGFDGTNAGPPRETGTP